MLETLLIVTVVCVAFLLFIVIRQYQQIDFIVTAHKNGNPQQHFYHLSQQLYQAVDAINQAVSQTSHQSQNLVFDSFQKIQKENQDQFSKSKLETQTIFSDLNHRFSHLESWQQQIQDLSHKVHQLSKVLDNNMLKGKFGEMHLENIIKSIYPSSWVSFQETLPNGTRVDCLLTLDRDLPKIPIDSKFPLQTFKMLINNPNQQEYLKDFTQVMKKNISDIAEKYIIDGLTTDYAIMFVPSDALFSRMIELDDLMQFSQESRVILCSPQTLFWLLSTMKKFLLDMHLSRDSYQKIALLNIISEQAHTLFDSYQTIEKKSVALTKEIRSLKNSVLELSELIDSLTELPEIVNNNGCTNNEFIDETAIIEQSEESAN